MFLQVFTVILLCGVAADPLTPTLAASMAAFEIVCEEFCDSS